MGVGGFFDPIQFNGSLTHTQVTRVMDTVQGSKEK